MLFGREDIACLLHAVQVKEGDLRIARTGTGPSMEWGSIKSQKICTCGFLIQYPSTSKTGGKNQRKLILTLFEEYFRINLRCNENVPIDHQKH
jgi:hypothetical protein